MKPIKPSNPRLVPGSRVRFPDGSLWDVLRVGPGSATVRCVVGGTSVGTKTIRYRDGREREVEVWDGQNVPGKRLEVSPHSLVETVNQG